MILFSSGTSLPQPYTSAPPISSFVSNDITVWKLWRIFVLFSPNISTHMKVKRMYVITRTFNIAGPQVNIKMSTTHFASLEFQSSGTAPQTKWNTELLTSKTFLLPLLKIPFHVQQKNNKRHNKTNIRKSNALVFLLLMIGI